MATNACKLICLLLIFAFVAQGYGQCKVENVTIVQYFTYGSVKTVPGLQVRVTNTCPCKVGDIKLSCNGFQSTTTVDSSKINKSGDVCLVNNGNALLPGQVFFFEYNWYSPFHFKILSAKIGPCS